MQSEPKGVERLAFSRRCLLPAQERREQPETRKGSKENGVPSGIMPPTDRFHSSGGCSPTQEKCTAEIEGERATRSADKKHCSACSIQSEEFSEEGRRHKRSGERSYAAARVLNPNGTRSQINNVTSLQRWDIEKI
jgi:hypothetical protein